MYRSPDPLGAAVVAGIAAAVTTVALWHALWLLAVTLGAGTALLAAQAVREHQAAHQPSAAEERAW